MLLLEVYSLQNRYLGNYSVTSTSPSLLQGELHLSHQASLPSGTRGCNRPPVLRTATL